MPCKDLDRAGIELQRLERELTQRLHNVLTQVSSGQKTQFFLREGQVADGFPDHLFLPESGELLELSRKTIELRKLLALPLDRSPGQLLISAFDETAYLENAHRLGPRRLALRLLSDLTNLQSTTL